MSKREAPMRLAAVARKFGFDNGPNHRANMVRFRRYLLAAERRSGEQVIVRMGTQKMPRYFVTESILRHICPELYPKRDQVAEVLRDHIDGVEEDISELRQRDKVIAQALSDRLKTLEKRVDELERVVRAWGDGKRC